MDIDECKAAEPPCDSAPAAKCDNTRGSFACECPTGSTGDGRGSDGCMDIDECAAAHAPCDARARCKNHDDGFDCICPKGYMGNGLGENGCKDIDECATNAGGCAPGTCMNTQGAYACVCPSGFSGTGTTSCSDINECLSNNGACDPLVTCTNTRGSRTCGACPQYYRGDGYTGCVHLWTRHLGTSGSDEGQGIALDAKGNVFVTGYTNGSLDGHTNAGSDDVFVVSLDSEGRVRWTQQLGSNASDRGSAIASDAAGNVYVTGYTEGALDGGSATGSTDLFVVKYDAAGTKQWTRQLGSMAPDYGAGVVTDSQGAVYVTGYTGGSLDGNASAGSYDIFLVKYNGAGVKQWTRQLGTTQSDEGHGIALDRDAIYVAGYTGGNLDGNTLTGTLDMFLTKYNLAGDKQWTRQLGAGVYSIARAVAADGAGNVYLAGDSNGALDQNSNAGGYDLIVAKFDGQGVKQWSRQLGTTTDEHGFGITADGQGNAYATGYTSGGLDGNSSAGGYDTFAVKYDSQGQKQWTRQLGTPYDDSARGIVSGDAGPIYVVGTNSYVLDGNASLGGIDAFVVKFDAAGNAL